jgi:hypothetical protein
MKRIDVKSQGRSRLRVQRRCMHARCGGVIPMASRRILHEDLSNATDDAKLFGQVWAPFAMIFDTSHQRRVTE